jgi:hypothetical protein
VSETRAQIDPVDSPPVDDKTIDWLLDGDPAIRWQVMRDLTGEPAETVSTERARVAAEGWGARLLSLQGADGNWGGGAYTPKWISTTYTLLDLRHLGIDPADEQVRRSVELVRARVVLGAKEFPFFEYHYEACVTAMTLALASYFLGDTDSLPQPEYLLDLQRPDGGWNCEFSSDRSSFHTTISVLEALLEYERACGGDPAAAEARQRAHEYLLSRRLMYSLSTGELVNKRWLLLTFPPRWHYDVLRGLDYLRDASAAPDPRAEEAMERVASKRRKDGKWPLQGRHPGRVHFEMEEGAGNPSRWNTLRALRVLDWYSPR